MKDLIPSNGNGIEPTSTADLLERDIHKAMDMYMQQRNANEEPEAEPSIGELIAASRLTKDLKKAAATLKDDQARYFVDLYYSLQKLRIGAAAQARAMMDGDEPNMLISWVEEMYMRLEADVKSALEVYAKSRVPGQWALSVKGIGPVIASGLLAHIDIKETPTAGALWSFAGYDPSVKWLGREKANQLVRDMLGPGKQKDVLTDEQFFEIAQAAHRNAKRLYKQVRDADGEITRGSVTAMLAKRPWNAKLKVLGWKIGESFVKSSGREGSFYGPMMREYKFYLMEKNERKEYADAARAAITEKNINDETEAYRWYSMGMLPPAHILARAKRHSVKMFLSHYFSVLYEHAYGTPSPTPYVIAHLEHQDLIPPPNWPLQG